MLAYDKQFSHGFRVKLFGKIQCRIFCNFGHTFFMEYICSHVSYEFRRQDHDQALSATAFSLKMYTFTCKIKSVVVFVPNKNCFITCPLDRFGTLLYYYS